jgi:hypothetical protein
MLRVFSLLCVAVVIAILGISSVSAEAVDRGPPYTDEQFLALAADRLPNGFRRDLPAWWKRAPGYLRHRILNAPSYMWWPIILCNYMGYKPEGMEAGGADKCEQDAYRASQRGKNFWTPDGQWIGPSEECKKRDKRTQWGELICD